MEDDELKIEEKEIETERKRLLRIYSKIDANKKKHRSRTDRASRFYERET